MTPTLRGRIHTRLFLSVVLGIPITLPFCVLALPLFPLPLAMLAIVVSVGLLLDPVYHLIQQRRWDHDWPVWIQLVAGVVELLLSGLVNGVLLLLLAVVYPLALIPLCLFPLHYGLVWGAIFLAGLGPMRVLFPHWRYRGGELGGDGRWG